jgi:protein-L-isoaspartate O-methyltransferase
MERLVWTPSEVVDVDGPRAMLRAYLEQRDVRTLLTTRHRGRVAAACDVGCGFGRMTSLLGEFADAVVGFEREPALVATARALLPGTDVRAIERL